MPLNPKDSKNIFLGITGNNTEGKKEAIAYLKTFGFEVFSLSDIVMEEIKSRNMPANKDSAAFIMGDLGKKEGLDVLAKRTAAKIINPKIYDEFGQNLLDYQAQSKIGALIAPGAVISAITQPLEAIALKNGLQRSLLEHSIHRVFYLVSLNDDAKPFTEGLDELADFKISKDYKSKEELIDRITNAVYAAKEYRKDAFYMLEAIHQSSRSDCTRRRVGAVIVSNQYDRVISAGYNGTPQKTKNCNEGGCPRCSDSNIPRGRDEDKCWCAHAEQNAIAFWSGDYAGSKGTTMYSTISPCISCTKLILQKDIRRVVFLGSYPNNDDVLEKYREKGIQMHHLKL